MLLQQIEKFLRVPKPVSLSSVRVKLNAPLTCNKKEICNLAYFLNNLHN